MKSLSTKYLDLIKGKLTRKQFLAEARRELPKVVTSQNSFKDAVKVLKGKGFLSIDKTLQSVEELCNEHTTLKNLFTERKVNPQQIRSVSNTKDRITLVTEDNKIHIFDIPQNTLFENTSPVEFVKIKRDRYLKEMVSEYPFTLTAIQQGIRFELKDKGLTTSSKLSDKDWDKIKDKVVKNLMKDSTYYIHKKAGTKPIKEKDRTDLTQEVPDVDRSKIDKKTTQKKVKDKNNQMEEVPLKEIKQAVKKLIISSLKEQEYSMPASDFKEGHRALVNMLEKIVSVAEKVGEAGEQERDALADDPDAATYAREVEEYLRKVYNAYLYADRDAGRDDEIFKEEVVKEVLSDEAYERMEGLSNTQAQQAVKKGSGIILRELTEEGFDETEVLEFLQVLIKTNYGIVTETRKVNEQDLTPIQALQQTSSFERALASEQDFANFIKRVEGDLWNYMASHFDNRAGAAPDELEEDFEEYKMFDSEEELNSFVSKQAETDSKKPAVDYSDYITQDDSGVLYIDTEDMDTGEKVTEPGEKIHFTYNGKEYTAVVTDKAVGRDDSNLMLALVAK